jgi:hypothetical protein
MQDDQTIRKFFDQTPGQAGKNPVQHNWERLYAAFPGATGWMSLSLPGYAITGDIAVVYVALYCGSLCGQGRYVYLQRIHGHWRVLVRVPVWVS